MHTPTDICLTGLLTLIIGTLTILHLHNPKIFTEILIPLQVPKVNNFQMFIFKKSTKLYTLQFSET